MDIDLLSKMVGELILDKDEVALPGVGTFVAELMPSTFSDKGYTINPPYRRLSFRQRESSDNSLVELYARSNDVDIRTAASIMGAFLKELKDTLKVRKTIIFPGLGRLRATRENNFFFIPDEDLNIYPEGFGLEPVSLKTHVETVDEMRAAVKSLQKIIEEPEVAQVESVAPVEEGTDSFAPLGMTEEKAGMTEEKVEVMEGAEPAVEEVPVVETVAEEETGDEEVSAEAEGEAVTVAVAEDDDEDDWDKYDFRSIHRKRVLKTVGIVAAALIVLLFGVFILLAHVAPDFIDKLLYSQEELDIIRQMKI